MAVSTLRLRVDPPDAALIAAERRVAEHGGEPVLHLPARGGRYLAVEGGVIDASYMYRSALHWAPLLNGYSGYEPPSYELILSLANALPEPLALKTLESLELVLWVVVHDELLSSQDQALDGSSPDERAPDTTAQAESSARLPTGSKRCALERSRRQPARHPLEAWPRISRELTHVSRELATRTHSRSGPGGCNRPGPPAVAVEGQAWWACACI
jgi:hypothetical protein